MLRRTTWALGIGDFHPDQIDISRAYTSTFLFPKRVSLPDDRIRSSGEIVGIFEKSACPRDEPTLHQSTWGQPELRYLCSSPCQAALCFAARLTFPSARKVTSVDGCNMSTCSHTSAGIRHLREDARSQAWPDQSPSRLSGASLRTQRSSAPVYGHWSHWITSGIALGAGGDAAPGGAGPFRPSLLVSRRLS